MTATPSPSPRVAAVVVTYNRRELAVEAVAALFAQTRRPDRVLVVDNASTDGSAAAISTRCPDAAIHRLPQNIGGAGGFAFGIAAALADGADLVWLLDDDTVARPTALAELLVARDRCRPAPAITASRVVWTDGRDHPMNTPRAKPFAGPAERRAARAAGCRPIRSASFVSVLVDAGAVRASGLPVADYFLWNDDFEFTARLLRSGRGIWTPDSVVEHRTVSGAAAISDPGDRFGYEVRNKIWLLTRSRALALPERVLYAAITLGRWARTIARADDKRRLARALCSGASAGLRRGPRPTDVILDAVRDQAPHQAPR